MTSVSAKLLEARKAKGLTQVQAAVLCKMDPNTYRDYERGVRPPTLKQIPSLSSVLGISEHWLIQQVMGAHASGAELSEEQADAEADFAAKLSATIDASKKKRAMATEVEDALRAMRNDPTVVVDLAQAVEDARRRLERKLGAKGAAPPSPSKKR